MKLLSFILKLSATFAVATICSTEVPNLPTSPLVTEGYSSLEVSGKESTDTIFSKTSEADLINVNNQKISTASIGNFPIVIAVIQNGITISFFIIIAGAVVVILLQNHIVKIKDNEVGIVNKKFGRRLPSNRQIALNGETGWQIKTLDPGTLTFNLFWIQEVIKEKAIQIDQDKIGLVEAKDGACLKSGQMFGKVVDCDDFQDGLEFINKGGQRGLQLAIIRNGTYRINTKLFDVQIREITHIYDNEIGLVEARDGKTLPFAKSFGDAVECSNFEDAQAFINNGGYRGKQLNILTAGKYAINTELFNIKKAETINIGANEVGLVEAIDGNPLPIGQNFGKVVECNNFQDAEAFIKNGGQKGKQLAIIPAGIYYINTELFKVRKEQVINIPPGEIAVVIAQDGEPLPVGQILGKAVDCNNFQDAEEFIKNGGQKGRQRAIITTGDYRINTEFFTVITAKNAKEHGMKPEELKVLTVNSEKIGIVTTLDGKPLSGGRIAGGIVDGHNKFQEVQKFIDAVGYRGLQEEILAEGSWSLNPWFVKVEQVPLTKIEAGTVGVVISNIGENFQQNEEQATDESRFNIVPRGYKGVEKIPLEAGKHSINTRVKNIEIVPTHEITLDWTNRDKPATNYDSNLKTLKLSSKDGFTFKLEVTQVINIAPKDASKMISRVGSPIANISHEVRGEEGAFNQDSDNAVKYSSIKNLVNRVLEPMVGNYFRNSAQEYDALDFQQQRDEIQEGATEYIKAALNAYGVQAVGTFINEIDLPNEIEERIKALKIAEVEREKLKREQETQKERQILIREKEIAESQAELVKAEQDAKIKERIAEAEAKAQQLLNDEEIRKKQQESDINAKEKEREVELELHKLLQEIQILSPQLYAKMQSDERWSQALANLNFTSPEIYIGGSSGNAGGLDGLQSGQYQIMLLEMLKDYLKDRNKPLQPGNLKSEDLIEPSSDQNQDSIIDVDSNSQENR